MNQFYILMIQELKAMEALRKRYEDEIESLPEGSLIRSRSKGRIYFHHSVKGKRRYISLKKREGQELALKLRRKKFLKEVVGLLDHNINVIKKAVKSYRPIDLVAISNEIAESYKVLPGKEREILPAFFPQHSDDMPFKSKSEALVAIIYESHGFEVQYERPIVIDGDWYHPDFTVRDPVYNELFYHEHLGMIDKRYYYKHRVVERLMKFWDAGIRLGENLILTFETKGHPLTIGMIEREVNRFLNERQSRGLEEQKKLMSKAQP